VKRSKRIRLVLIGGLSAGMWTGCDPAAHGPASITPSAVYTNNHQVPGIGFYHAPFRAWYAHPYNHYDTAKRAYFYGGQWWSTRHESITNISQPTVQAANQAQAQRTDIHRGGFGSTSRSHGIWS
jgi:hypothetical protein